MIYFTSDLHLGHHGIITMRNRPFANVEEMNRTLITNFNAIVNKNDTVYILGDLAHHMQVEDVNKLLAQFKQMQKMVKQIGGNKGPKMSKKMRRMMQANPEMAEKMMGKMGGGSNNPFGL